MPRAFFVLSICQTKFGDGALKTIPKPPMEDGVDPAHALLLPNFTEHTKYYMVFGRFRAF